MFNRDVRGIRRIVQIQETERPELVESVLAAAAGARAPLTGTDFTESFEQFWQLYPLKKNRHRALKAWLRLRPSAALVTEILDALTSQADELTRDDGEYCPHAVSWLKNRRWEDEG
jgi:hypothetical protein